MTLTSLQQQAVDRLLMIRPKGRRASGAMYARSRKAIRVWYGNQALKLGYTAKQVAVQWQDILDMADLEKYAENPHKSFSSLNAKRARAEAAVLAKAEKHYAKAAQLEKQRKPLQARAEAAKGRALIQQARKAGAYTDGPVGRLPNPKRKRNTTVAGLRTELAQVDRDIAELETDPFYRETAGRRAYARKWLAHHRRQRREIERLIKRRSNGITEAAAGLQALEYLGSKVRGKKNPFDPKNKHGITRREIDTARRRVLSAAAGESYNKAYRYYRTLLEDAGYTETEAGKLADHVAQIREERKKRNPSEKTSAQRKAIIKALRHHSSDHLREVVKKNDDPDIKEIARAILAKRTRRSPSGLKHNPGDVHIDAGHVTIVGKTKRIKTQNPIPMQSSTRSVKQLDRRIDTLSKKRRALYDAELSHAVFEKRYKQLSREIDRAIKLRDLALRRKIQNPSVTTLSKTFQGEANGAMDEYYASDAAPKNLARAGKLVFLKVAGRSLRLPGAMVAIAPNNKLWITGKQALFSTKARPGEGLDVGEVSHICYETAKAHIENGETVEYVHEFGEDGGKRPHLIIDHEGMPILRGGDYKIRAEGIVN